MRDIKRMRAVFVPLRDAEALWEPAVDVYRSGAGWLIKMEAAGVRLEDIQVAIRDNAVLLKGVRRDRIQEQEGEFSSHSMEIDYAPFERKIVLPGQLSVNSIELETREGFILVRLS
jgi:HSP20 family protein